MREPLSNDPRQAPSQGSTELPGSSALDREVAALDQLSRLFDFDNYPGLDDFFALAEAAPECADFS